jgi:hypothetical protein
MQALFEHYDASRRLAYDRFHLELTASTHATESNRPMCCYRATQRIEWKADGALYAIFAISDVALGDSFSRPNFPRR